MLCVKCRVPQTCPQVTVSVTDFIKNEILSQNLDLENLLNQWASDGPLKMEEDVSFDQLNLPNTLECMTQQYNLEAKSREVPVRNPGKI